MAISALDFEAVLQTHPEYRKEIIDSARVRLEHDIGTFDTSSLLPLFQKLYARAFRTPSPRPAHEPIFYMSLLSPHIRIPREEEIRHCKEPRTHERNA